MKSLTLLSAEINGETVYLVVPGMGISASLDDASNESAHWYESRICPSDFLHVDVVMTADDTDPHGLFSHVETVWEPPEYEAAVDKPALCRKLFKVFQPAGATAVTMPHLIEAIHRALREQATAGAFYVGKPLPSGAVFLQGYIDPASLVEAVLAAQDFGETFKAMPTDEARVAAYKQIEEVICLECGTTENCICCMGGAQYDE